MICICVPYLSPIFNGIIVEILPSYSALHNNNKIKFCLNVALARLFGNAVSIETVMIYVKNNHVFNRI